MAGSRHKRGGRPRPPLSRSIPRADPAPSRLSPNPEAHGQGEGSRSPSAPWWKGLVPIVALILIPLALYGRAIGFGYVQADDTDLVVKNQAFLNDLANVPEAFRRSYFDIVGQPGPATYYRPLVIASFMLDAQVSGPAPFMFHATNVALHIGVVLLLFCLLLLLSDNRGAAFAGALVFAVHPLNIQAVCWIVGRNDLLMAGFGLLALVGLVQHMRTRSRAALALHLCGFVCALFSKETAVLLPVLFVMYAWLWARNLRWYRRRLPLVAAYAAAGIGWYVLRRAALGGSGGPSLTASVVTLQKAGGDLLLYIGKILLPFNLNVTPGLDRAGALVGVAALAGLAFVSWRYLQMRPRLFAIGWFLLFLLPSVLIVVMPAYEHRAYFPLIGVVVAFATAPALAGALVRPSGVVVAGIVAVTFGLTTATRTGVYADRYAYWTDAARGKAYGGIAHVNLGLMHEEDGRVDQAHDHYRRALELDPTTPNANNNLGIVMMKKGRYEEAREHFEREVHLNPSNASAHYNLGIYMKLAGRIDEAVPHWTRAIQVDPYYVAAYRQLAGYYTGKGNLEEARRYEEKARALESDKPAVDST